MMTYKFALAACLLLPCVLVMGFGNSQPAPEDVTAFMDAVKDCQTAKIQTMLDRWPNGEIVNSSDQNGWTALHYAAAFDFVNVAQMLIQHGGLINARNRAGSTPIHVASQMGRWCTARVLIQNGADINVCNHSGMTPLAAATLLQKNGMIELLVEHGANNPTRQIVSHTIRRPVDMALSSQ